MSAIVVDLDGTLCNADHRFHHLIVNDYDAFHSALMGDDAHLDVNFLLHQLSIDVEVILCTGRNEAFRNMTNAWLRLHNLDQSIDHILMRPDGDFRPDDELKPAMLERHFGSRTKVLEEVIFVLDDRDKVVEAWRNYGLPCWQVRPGGY